MNPNCKDLTRAVWIAVLIIGTVALVSRTADAQITSQQAINTVRAVLNDSLNHEGTYPPWNCEWDEDMTGYFECGGVITVLQMEYLARRGEDYDGAFTGLVIAHEVELTSEQQAALECNLIQYRYFNKAFFPDTLSLADAIKNFIGPIIEVDIAGCVISSTGDKQSDADRIRIMPNPISARGECTIAFPSKALINGEVGIYLINASGKKVMESSALVEKNRITWQVPNLEAGLYMVVIRTSHHNYSSKIFISW